MLSVCKINNLFLKACEFQADGLAFFSYFYDKVSLFNRLFIVFSLLLTNGEYNEIIGYIQIHIRKGIKEMKKTLKVYFKKACNWFKEKLLLAKIKGKEVTGAEKSDIKTLTANYAENKRGNIPQMVAGILAATMLASMLASCDEITGSTLPGEDTTAVESGEQTTVPEEEVNIQKYDKLKVEDVGEVTIDGMEVSVHDIGLGLLKVFDYKDIMTFGSSYSSALMTKYNEIMANPSNYNFEDDAITCMALNRVANPQEKRDNISLGFEEKVCGWKHNIVSTNYNFALESTDSQGNVYLTGFVNGKYENDLGLIDADTIKILKAMAKIYSYNDIVNAVRLEFFSAIYVYDEVLGNKQISQDFKVSTEGKPWNDVDFINRTYKLGKLFIRNERSTYYIDIMPNYEVSDNYFDTLLESGVVVNNGTVADDNHADKKTN